MQAITRRSLFGLVGAATLALGSRDGSALAQALPQTRPAPPQTQTRALVIFAAASLKNALDEIAAAYAKEAGKVAPKLSYAASNALAKQIEAGAPADLFISADLDWMDYVAGKSLIRPDSRLSLVGNRIVLIAPKDSSVALNLGPGLNLGPALAGGRLAMGSIDAVPAGKYGNSVLEKLGA